MGVSSLRLLLSHISLRVAQRLSLVYNQTFAPRVFHTYLCSYSIQNFLFFYRNGIMLHDPSFAIHFFLIILELVHFYLFI